MKKNAQGKRVPPDPGSWPSFLAWLGHASWSAWFKITTFVLLIVWFAHRIGWF
jgi:hypothetical protein